MNSVFFGFKRAYYGTLRGTRPHLKRLGLTAARYDVLALLERFGAMLQREVRASLNVAAPTVSRMLKALEALGLIARSRPSDRRQREVRLTFRGRTKLDEVNAWTFCSGPEDTNASDSPFVEISTVDGFWYDVLLDESFVEYLELTERKCKELGPRFGPYHYWHPDD
jgi:DNA-binding MarR family transcriptional regulator